MSSASQILGGFRPDLGESLAVSFNAAQYQFSAQELADGGRSNVAKRMGRCYAATAGHIADAQAFDLFARLANPLAVDQATVAAKSIFNPTGVPISGAGVPATLGNSTTLPFCGEAVAGSGTGTWLAVCTQAVGSYHLARSLNNGATWTGITVAAGVATSPAFVRYFAEVGLFITALGNEIYTSGDGGSTWTKRYSSPGITLFHDVAKKPGGNFVAVGVLAANGAGRVTYSADGITWLDTACAVGATCNALTSIDYDATAGLFLTVERSIGSTEDRKIRTSPQGTAWSAGATITAQTDGNSATRVRAHGGLFFLDVARSSAGFSRTFVTANGSSITSPPGFNGTPLWGVAGQGMVFLVAAMGSATYRPHLRVTNDGGATASTLSDWLGLSADVTAFAGNLLPALAGGGVLSCAVGSNTAFYTSSTAPKSMRVPMLTRIH